MRLAFLEIRCSEKYEYNKSRILLEEMAGAQMCVGQGANGVYFMGSE